MIFIFICSLNLDCTGYTSWDIACRYLCVLQQITIVDFVKKLEEFCEFPYSVIYMKQNLMQKMTKTLLLLIFMEKLMSHFFTQL